MHTSSQSNISEIRMHLRARSFLQLLSWGAQDVVLKCCTCGKWVFRVSFQRLLKDLRKEYQLWILSENQPGAYSGEIKKTKLVAGVMTPKKQSEATVKHFLWTFHPLTASGVTKDGSVGKLRCEWPSIKNESETQTVLGRLNQLIDFLFSFLSMHNNTFHFLQIYNGIIKKSTFGWVWKSFSNSYKIKLINNKKLCDLVPHPHISFLSSLLPLSLPPTLSVSFLPLLPLSHPFFPFYFSSFFSSFHPFLVVYKTMVCLTLKHLIFYKIWH